MPISCTLQHISEGYGLVEDYNMEFQIPQSEISAETSKELSQPFNALCEPPNKKNCPEATCMELKSHNYNILPISWIILWRLSKSWECTVRHHVQDTL